MNVCRESFRLLAILGVGVLGLLTLVGCGGGGGGGDEGGSPAAPKAWGTALLIETDDTGNAENPQIALDSSGNAIAVWQQTDGPIKDIWANRFSAGTGNWGTAAKIELGTGDAELPQIAMDGSGNALAVWSQPGDIFFEIWAARFNAGTGAWVAAEKIGNGVGGGAFAPRIAVNAGGNAIAVWEQFGNRNNIWANRFSASAWDTAVRIDNDVGHANVPQIVVDGSGNAIAVWYQTENGDPNGRRDIWASRYDAVMNMWDTAMLIETDNTGQVGAFSPRIAMDGSGNAIAVWFQSDTIGRNSIWANRFVAGSGWGTALLIETDDAGNAEKPQIAVDSSGNAIAVWRQRDNMSNENIYANRFDAGTGMWGAAVLIETNDTGLADDPQIAVDGSGNALAVWRQTDSSTITSIWANRFSAGAWGTAQLIETDNAGNALFPQIAVDGSGNALAVWQQSDGARINIWANRFD